MITIKKAIIIIQIIIVGISKSLISQSVTVTPTEAHINEGESVQLTASGAMYYLWNPSVGLSNTEGSSVMASPLETTTYTATGFNPSSTELVINGSFEQGNYGFSSSYQCSTDLVPEGTYYVGENANDYHYGFIGTGHGGYGNFMIVNGAMEPETNVWTEQIPVTPNTNYAFSTWICNVSVGDPDVVALLQFSINGVQFGEIFSGINELNIWEQFYVIWNSGSSTTATITILNQNNEAGGNDFGLDDISFRELENVGDGQCTVFVQPLMSQLPDNIDSANCVFFPEGVEWGIKIDWSSNENVSYIIPLVGDLDNDEHPEIVTFTPHTEPGGPYYLYNLLVFDGVTKQLKTTIALPSSVSEWDEAPFGLVKLPSGVGLIVVACTDYKLRAYDITTSNPSIPYWVSSEDYGDQYGDWASNINFADFNNDGHPEVFIRNKIYNAETGILLASTSGGTNTGSSYAHWTHPSNVQWKVSAPIASNIIGDSSLELILGNEIYTVNIVNPNDTIGNSAFLALSITPPSGVSQDGHSQVVDFDNDGFLDIFISLRTSASTTGIVYGYVWDVHHNTISQPFMINTSFSGKSTPLIADIDNDSKVEVVIQCAVSGSEETFLAYKYNSESKTFSLLWSYYSDEDSYSNSITAFDFNQDELLELLISDQSAIRIVNGSGKSHLTHNDTLLVYPMTTLPLPQPTCMQYPVIVDVDNDGSADILSVSNHKLVLLKSNTEPWPPARKVWNQYMYNITCVNEDLTIPQYIFNNAYTFIDPQGIVRRPYNNFLQQATTLDQYGQPIYPVPDAVAISTNYIVENGNALLNIIYANYGDNTLNAPYSITVFANQFGGDVVKTITVNTSLPIGETDQQNIPLSLSELCSSQDVSALVVAINCAGGGIAQYGNQQPECDITNNTAQIIVNLQSEPTSFAQTACNQFVWNGITYSQSGEYEQTLSNCYGCDSVVTMQLTILGQIETGIEASTCEEAYNWNGIVYHEPGIYQQSFLSSTECDSIVNLHLTFNSGSNYSIHGSTSLYSSTDIISGYYHYHIDSTGINPSNVQWSIDQGDWLLYPHGASCDLLCTSAGRAELHAWTEGEVCDVDTVLVLNASFFDIDESLMPSASVYPNPTNGNVRIVGQDITTINVFNILGQNLSRIYMDVQNEYYLDISRFSQGVYLLEIVMSQGKCYRQVVLTN